MAVFDRAPWFKGGHLFGFPSLVQGSTIVSAVDSVVRVGTDLASLFTKQEVRAQTIKYLESIGCNSIVMSASWVDCVEGLNDVASLVPFTNEHVRTAHKQNSEASELRWVTQNRSPPLKL